MPTSPKKAKMKMERPELKQHQIHNMVASCITGQQELNIPVTE